MKRRFKISILLLVLTGTCFSQEGAVKRIPAREHPSYGPYIVPALNELVAQYGKVRRNHFYVGRVQLLESGYHSVLVYWKENRVLVLWEPGRGYDRHGYPDPKYDLAASRRYWRLDKDVVPTRADIGGSSFLITQQDARDWMQDCMRYGERYVIDFKPRQSRRRRHEWRFLGRQYFVSNQLRVSTVVASRSRQSAAARQRSGVAAHGLLSADDQQLLRAGFRQSFHVHRSETPRSVNQGFRAISSQAMPARRPR